MSYLEAPTFLRREDTHRAKKEGRHARGRNATQTEGMKYIQRRGSEKGDDTQEGCSEEGWITRTERRKG